METITKLEVRIGSDKIGDLALYKNRLAAFAYTPEWIRKGFSISPFQLPLKSSVFIPKYDPFDGLFGIFADSLPDGWGRLLVDRMLLREKVDPLSVGSLNRLAIVGSSGMGALSYFPSHQWKSKTGKKDFDLLAEECRKILVSERPDDLDFLFQMGGSSGGARPKILIQLDGEDWIVKFPSSSDPADIGRMEYDYSVTAAKCGIEMPKTALFPSRKGSGYFGTLRFDRTLLPTGEIKRIHMASVSALLEISHRIPALDYHSLMALTWQLTKDYQELEKMYRLMCFNVFSHNRDDHSKNFSFLYDQERWRLSPAYDLTYSNSLGGEHTTTINGNGKNPGLEDILAVAKKAGIHQTKARAIAEEIREIVYTNLKEYLHP